MALYSLCFYVPLSHAEQVKDAVFAAGAGRIDHYERCCFESVGTGQFVGTDGSHPYSGAPGELQRVRELKIEVFCEEECLARAIEALRSAHPYETPTFNVLRVERLHVKA
jgi:hypothetical protein